MKKLLVYICTLMMAFMLGSCQTSNKPAPPTAHTGVYNKALDGKWNGTISWRTAYDTGSNDLNIMVQKGVAVMESTELKVRGTVDGNIIHVESTDFTNARGARVHYPDRDFIISEDGKTITIDFEGSWANQVSGGSIISGWVKVDGILTRE